MTPRTAKPSTPRALFPFHTEIAQAPAAAAPAANTKRLARTVVAALLVASAWPAHALPDALFEPAAAQFAQATAGHADAIGPAAQAFAQLLQAEPTNPVLLAYSGAATSLRHHHLAALEEAGLR